MKRREFLKAAAAAAAIAQPVLRLGVQVDIETSHQEQPEGCEYRAWIAWYADDEPDDFGEMAFGYGSTEERAISALMNRFPREVQP